MRLLHNLFFLKVSQCINIYPPKPAGKADIIIGGFFSSHAGIVPAGHDSDTSDIKREKILQLYLVRLTASLGFTHVSTQASNSNNTVLGRISIVILYRYLQCKQLSNDFTLWAIF
jgi:hypothetical protein